MLEAPRPGDRAAFYWLLAAAVVAIAAGIGLRDPWPADEPRFALIARDMVDTGRWFFPRVADVLYPDKPPLYFWVMGIFYYFFGSIRAAFLLPSLGSALLILVLVYDLARRLWGRAPAWWAAASLLTCIQFLLFAKSARIDAMLAMLVTLGMYGILRHLLLGPDWKWYFAGFAASGLGVITKGVGFLPAVVLLAYLPARRWHWNHVPRFPGRWWQWLLGPGTMLAVIALWLVPMLWLVAVGDDPALQAYRDNILFAQTAERYVNPSHHLAPLWYFPVEVIPLFWFPLSLALFWLVPAWKPAFKTPDARLLLPLAWVVMVIVFFSLSPAKRGSYILPALPMLALCAAPYLSDIAASRSARSASLAVLAGSVLLLASIVIWIQLGGNARFEQLVQRYDVQGEIVWVFAALGATAACCLVFAWRRQAIAGLAAWLAGFWVVLGLVAYPILNDARTPQTVMRKAGAIVGSGQLGLVGWKAQHVLFADRPLVHFGYRRPDWQAELHDGLVWLLHGDNRYLLVTDKYPSKCLDLSRAENMGYRHRQNWYLVEPQDVVRECRTRLQGMNDIGKIYYANQGRSYNPGPAPR